MSRASIMKEEGEWGCILTLLHSERPKLYGVLAVLSAIGLICTVLSAIGLTRGRNGWV